MIGKSNIVKSNSTALRLRILIALFFFALTGNVFAQSDDIGCEFWYSRCPTLPIIEFKNTVFLSKIAKLRLDSAVKISKQYAMCKIMMSGNGTFSQKSQQYSWDRAVSVIIYLKKKGVKKERLILMYGEDGNPELVILVGIEFKDTPSWTTQPSPHPGLSLHSRKVVDFFTSDYNFHNSL